MNTQWYNKLIHYLSTLAFLLIIFILFIPTTFEVAKVYAKEFLAKEIQFIINDSEEGNYVGRFIDDFESKFGSKIFSKQLIASLDTNLYFRIKGQVNSNQVLLGENEWLFYKTQTDGDPMADLAGTNIMADEDMAILKTNLLAYEALLAQNDIELIIVFAPNKENIYQDMLPEEISISGDGTKMDVLYEYLIDETDLNISYSKEALLTASNDYPVYYNVDSHWNKIGAFVAYKEFIEFVYNEKFNINEYEIKEVEKVNGPGATDDLAQMIGMEWYFNQETEYVVQEYMDAYKLDEVSLKNNLSKYDDKVYIIGDSFRTTLQYYFNQDFDDINVIHRNNYDLATVLNEKPDIVVVEYVERYVQDIKDFEFIKQ